MFQSAARLAARKVASAATRPAAATSSSPITAAAAAPHPRPAMSTNMYIAAAAVVAAGAYGVYLRSQPPVRADDGSAKFFGGFPPLKSLRLHSAELINHNTKRLRFELPDKDSVSGLSLTSATLTVSFPNGSWVPVPRPYTPVSDLNQKGYVEYLIKHYPGGKGSTAMHNLKPGEHVYFMPIPGYKWSRNKHTHVAMVAGGAGITPMYQLARHVLADPADSTRLTLVWGVNEDRDLFLADEFDRLAAEHPGRFRAVYVVSKPGSAGKHKAGYVTGDLLREAGVVPPGGEKAAAGDTKVLVCGPPAMEKALTKGADGGVLGALGFAKGQIHQF
ncbi:hypothetical protein RB597_009431 [Gaeumannomyces tritici]